MATPINQMGLASLLLGEWEKTKQPLQQRGTVLPVGDYEDGRAGLAWPGLLAAPAEGMANFGRYGYGEDAVADNARSAFDVAGGAVTGGLGVGLAGGMADDAVRAAPKANAQAGPAIATRETRTPFVEALANSMTPDARTDGVFYRGVNDPASPASDMWWASNSPRSASHFAIGDNAAVFPSTMKFSNPLELDAGGAWWESVPFAGGEKSTFDIAKLARDEGYDGVTFRNVQDDPYGGTVSDVVAALHPGTVYSATTGDLLYSNAPTGSALPLAMEGQDQDPALIQFLRSRGQF